MFWYLKLLFLLSFLFLGFVFQFEAVHLSDPSREDEEQRRPQIFGRSQVQP